MIKSTFYNSLLVLALSFMFALPFVGFGFIGYTQTDYTKTNVLGAKTTALNTEPSKKSIKLVDQIEIKVSLPSTDEQTTIDLTLSEEYKSDELKKIIIIPQKFIDLGIYATFNEDFSKIIFNSNNPSKSRADFTATILILNAELAF